MVWAKWVVKHVESLDAREWERFQAHPKYTAFMAWYLRAKCLTDFRYHIRYVLYFHAMKHLDWSLHEQVCTYINTWRIEEHGEQVPVNLSFLFMSREHVKTQLATIGYASWRMAQDENSCGLVRAFTDEKAGELGETIRDTVMSSGYQWMYPWVFPKQLDNGQRALWRPDVLMLSRNEIKRTPTLQCIGMKKDPTGGHLDYLIYDDYEVKQNATSPELLKDMLDKFFNDTSLMLGGGCRLFVGTFWSTKAIVYQAMMRLGKFKEMQYALFVMPCMLKVLDKSYAGKEPILESDGVTLRDGCQSFPAEEGLLRHCRVVVRFFDKAAGDVVEQGREVVAHGPTWLRVNRPFSAHLGQPLGYEVHPEKPVAPKRFCMDDQDIHPEPGEEHRVIVRKSLPLQKRQAGSYVWLTQWMLQAYDAESLLLNPDLLKAWEWDGETPIDNILPGPKYWYQCSDFATAGRTRNASAMTTGFKHETGDYILRIQYDLEMNVVDKLLELFMAELWVRKLGHKIRERTFEKAHIEKTLGELLPQVEDNPHRYFSGMKVGRSKLFERSYTDLADEFFRDKGRIPIQRRALSRGEQAKTYRVAQWQTGLESGRVHVWTGCKHFKTLQDHMKAFTLESEELLDLLETARDFHFECLGPSVAVAPKRERNEFAERQREALKRSGMGRSLVGVYRRS